jgi:hypothetical protein
MTLADMDPEVATRILAVEAMGRARQAEATFLAAAEAYRATPDAEHARAAVAAFDRWAEARLEATRRETDHRLAGLLEELDLVEDADGPAVVWLREVARDRLDMGDRGSTAAHGGELARGE